MHEDMEELAREIHVWGRELGFAAVGITDAGALEGESGLAAWLGAGCHGAMDYMAAHRDESGAYKRARPQALLPGTRSIIVVRMDYYPFVEAAATAGQPLDDGELARISCYALGRDYHKLLRARLQRLAERIGEAVGDYQYRAFTDSAPVMEIGLAQRAGVGWRGKHTLLLERDAGSWFFLGELFTSLPLPADVAAADHCGRCTACLQSCPTEAFSGPYRLDARRCISYLTIELPGAIPLELRPLLGNRIYGCDDCQQACPWNRFAKPTAEADFLPRQGLDAARLTELFAWSEHDFEQRLQGSPIRRIGHERWLRNIAVALGNAPTSDEVLAALRSRREHPSALVREHVEWALGRHTGSD